MCSTVQTADSNLYLIVGKRFSAMAIDQLSNVVGSEYLLIIKDIIMEHMINLKEQAYIKKEYIILDRQFCAQLTAKSKSKRSFMIMISLF